MQYIWYWGTLSCPPNDFAICHVTLFCWNGGRRHSSFKHCSRKSLLPFSWPRVYVSCWNYINWNRLTYDLALMYLQILVVHGVLMTLVGPATMKPADMECLSSWRGWARGHFRWSTSCTIFQLMLWCEDMAHGEQIHELIYGAHVVATWDILSFGILLNGERAFVHPMSQQ